MDNKYRTVYAIVKNEMEKDNIVKEFINNFGNAKYREIKSGNMKVWKVKAKVRRELIGII